ncbi:Glutathione S-transferase DHAR2 [Galdieria sulphuraria]|nr:Glutathione S-transferase DHAR2 [Galdieria sulphuraria]
MSGTCFVAFSSYISKQRRLCKAKNFFSCRKYNICTFSSRDSPLFNREVVRSSPAVKLAQLLIASIPTWTELESKVSQLLGSKVYSYRLGEWERYEDCRVVIFTDENLWCPYTKRICFQLEEKSIPYRFWYLNMFQLPSWYKDINPRCQVPTAIIDGEIVYDSPVIMKYIEDRFPETKPLMPESMTKKMKEDLYDFERLERRISNTWLLWFDKLFSEEESLDSFYFTLDRVEEALHIYPGPFFFGEHFSLVDILYAPFMDAIAATALYYKGIPVRKTGGLFPAIEEWFDALSRRPVYQNIRSDEMTMIRALPYQFDHTEILPQEKRIAERMETDMRNMDMKQVKKDPFESQNRLLASSKLIHERTLILEVLRSSLGIPHDSTDFVTLDTMLRFVSNVLIEGYFSMQDFVLDNLSLISSSLNLLKDTIQVPRDLKYPAFRQLIAYLNFIMDNLKMQAESQELNHPV